VTGKFEALFDRARAKLNHLVSGTRYEHYRGHAWMLRNVPSGDDENHPYRSTLRLKENGVPLLFAHQKLGDVVQFGAGRYCHWRDDLVFSTSDNSDPNTNGRFYTFDFHLDPETWERARAVRLSALWQFHPRAGYFLSRGGTEIAPPVACNVSLTNKCNLRCEICGSQKYLDVSGIRRRHMDRRTFETVAETIFPVLLTVELNSQGDPLLYPNIADVLARIKANECEVKVQTNGTLFTDDVIPPLIEQHGIVMLSLDAVGPRFDEVREGGNWARAEPGLRRFLSARDPRRLSTGIYPTLTQRTIGEAISVVTWAAEHGIDLVAFHRYVPIANSWEKPPEQREYDELVDTLRQWAARHSNPIEIRFEAEVLNDRPFANRRTEFANAQKQMLVKELRALAFPVERHGQNADPTYICTSPISYIEIGLDGQIGACCRAQDIPLGRATSVEGFADTWFGANYARIRDSLRWRSDGRFALPNCESCVHFFAPISGSARTAVRYDCDPTDANALDLGNAEVIEIEGIQKETRHCWIARIPPGVKAYDYAFFEDDRCLSAHVSMHDAIRELGGGRYAINGRALYFSTSDRSDPRRNNRSYQLQRLPLRDGDVALHTIVFDGGHAFVAEFPDAADATSWTLLENDSLLGPAACLHDEIRRQGAGRYCMGSGSLHFSASDNSDPRVNGRLYRLRRLRPVS
jgi:MoaA/NifB/PqqE/SkfB family radical SAM enzyme